MERVKQAQKKLYADLHKLEKEVESLQDMIAQVKALGHSAEEQEKKLEMFYKLLKKVRQRIEDLWQYSIPYGLA